MTTGNVGDFLHRLTRGMSAQLLAVESDRELVERVLATRDESALLTIVLRHGAMVYHVCRRVLRHPQDAEDAFQATFLVLAQELHALRQHSSLAGWLHGVALRVSRKAKARAMARQRWEAGAALPEAVPPDDLTWNEVRSALDAELIRLPDKWRLPLVLCYLEGQTQDEAANQLGWSKSTLRRRLEQARAALGTRLKGRGIAWSAVLPAVLASDSLLAAAMSLACVDATVAAALAVVNGKSLALAASAKVAVLTEGVLKTMFAKKIGIVAGALIVLTLVTAAIGGHFFAANAGPTEVQPERGAQRPVGPEDERPVVFRAGKLPKGLPDWFYSLDLNGDGQIDLYEWRKGKKPLDEFKEWDRNEDGFITAEEVLFRQGTTITLKGHTSEVASVCFSPDGKRIVTGGGVMPRVGKQAVPGEVKVWDAEKGTEILALKGHTDTVWSVCFSPDGKRVASAGADQTVRVWDADKGQEIFILKEQTRGTGSVCFSPDGKRLATISSEDIKVWDAEKGQELLTLTAKGRPNSSVCFSPDGKRLAGVYPWGPGGARAPGQIKVWDAEKGQELLTLMGHKDFVFSVCFSPDGKRLASAGADQTVRVWDAEKGQGLLALKGHASVVSSVCFSPDGKRLASASWDKSVKVWDAQNGQELLTLKGHTDLLRSVCFSPDGKRLASASKDKTVKVWSLDMEK